MAFDERVITSPGNRSTVEPGNVVPSLNGSPGMSIAFPAQMSGTQCASAEDLCPVLQSRNPTAVAIRTAQTKSNGWGVNTDGVAYTLDSAQQGVKFGNAVRRLTPRECERLQGFPDDWTKYFDTEQISGNVSKCLLKKIRPLEIAAPLTDVIDALLTARSESASCTISASSATEQRISLFADSMPQTRNANAANPWLDYLEQRDFARAITNHGSDTAILVNPTARNVREQRTEKDTVRNLVNRATGPLLSVCLEENYSRKSESIILTWTKKMTFQAMFGSMLQIPRTCEVIIHWNASRKNSSQSEWCGFTMEDMNLFSDSTRYRMLGNAVAVPVARWIAARICAHVADAGRLVPKGQHERAKHDSTRAHAQNEPSSATAGKERPNA